MTWFIGHVSQKGPRRFHDRRAALLSRTNAPFFVPTRMRTLFVIIASPPPDSGAGNAGDPDGGGCGGTGKGLDNYVDINIIKPCQNLMTCLLN
jgi:hypothetical protein